MMPGVWQARAAPRATIEPCRERAGLDALRLFDGLKDLKTSDARWRESIASGSASPMSSPGACTNRRVSVGYQPIRFAAVASISALGSVLFAMSQDSFRAVRRPVLSIRSSPDSKSPRLERFPLDTDQRP
jgi:hypothetical protein